MKTRLITAFLLTLIFASAIFDCVTAQSIYWATQIGSTGGDLGRGTLDKQGNIYFAGSFSGYECFLNNDTLLNPGQNGICFIKYDTYGNEVWAHSLGGDNNFPGAWGQGGHVCFDTISNSLIIGGTFFGPAYFGPFHLYSQWNDIFLAKYDLDGNCLWARSYGGRGLDGCSSITMDNSGNIFMIGETTDSAYFNSYTVDRGGFMAKFDPAGYCLWAKHEVNYDPYFTAAAGFMDIACVSDDEIIVNGSIRIISEIVQIDTITISHPESPSTILCGFDGSGNIRWVREGLARGISTTSQIALDSTGNIYYSGSFSDTIHFDNQHLYSGSDNVDMFLVKYDRNGNFIWVRQAESTMADGATVSSDLQGNVYVTGHFSDFAGFGGFNITAISNKDMFVARYSPGGSCIGVIHSGNCEGWGVSQDQAGNPYVVLTFRQPTELGSETFTPYGSYDILVFKCASLIGVKEIQKFSSDNLIINPNPTTGNCNIIIPDEFILELSLMIRIFDVQGKLIQTIPLTNEKGKSSVNINAEAKGMYNVILSNGKKNYSGKIIFR